MTDKKYCSGCRRYQPADQLQRKRLPRGGVRLVCLACLARARSRADQPPTHKDPR